VVAVGARGVSRRGWEVEAGIHGAEEEADNGDREMGQVAGAEVRWRR
jgi:hypothetical protein